MTRWDLYERLVISSRTDFFCWKHQNSKFMRSSVFQYPFEKMMRTTKGALRHMGLRIVRFDKFEGRIQAVSGFSLLKPSLTVDLQIEEMNNHNIRVTVNGHSVRQHFFQRNVSEEASEAEILEKVSTLL